MAHSNEEIREGDNVELVVRGKVVYHDKARGVYHIERDVCAEIIYFSPDEDGEIKRTSGDVK